MTYEEIINAIDEETDPDLMSKEEAVEFIGNIVGQLQGKLEALEMEIEDENK